jgi:hypothetical protein
MLLGGGAGFMVFQQMSPTSCGEIQSTKTREVVVHFPADSTFTVMMVDYPVGFADAGDNMLHIIRHGESEVAIGVYSGKIEEWDVAPQDERCFRRIAREPLEDPGD